jgi:hypothetical protein
VSKIPAGYCKNSMTMLLMTQNTTKVINAIFTPKYGECTLIALFLFYYSPLFQLDENFRSPDYLINFKFFVATDHRKSVILKAFMSKPENDKLLALLYQFNIEKIEVVLITNQSGYLQIRHVTILVLIHD